MHGRNVIRYIDYVEKWAYRFSTGIADHLCQRALGLVGLRAQRCEGGIVGLVQIRRGVWGREPERDGAAA